MEWANDPEVERDREVRPPEADQHLRQRVIVAAHPQTIEEWAAVYGVSEKTDAHRRVSSVENPFGQRMMIAANRADLPVRKQKVLPLERVPAPDQVAFERDEIFVADAAVAVPGQPARYASRVEDEIVVRLASPQALVERLHSRFMFCPVRSDVDRHP